MDWLHVVLGALAAGGLLAAFRWLKGLLSASGRPQGGDTPEDNTRAAVAAARATVVQVHEDDLDQVLDSLKRERSEDTLADMINRRKK